MGKVVKQSGKNVPQQRRANGKSYQSQVAKSSGRQMRFAPKPPPTKRRFW